MSPVIEPTRLSTVLFAWLRLHGEDDEHAVPEPRGDTYSVVCTAALASAAPSPPRQATGKTNPTTERKRNPIPAVHGRRDLLIIRGPSLASRDDPECFRLNFRYEYDACQETSRGGSTGDVTAPCEQPSTASCRAKEAW